MHWKIQWSVEINTDNNKFKREHNLCIERADYFLIKQIIFYLQLILILEVRKQYIFKMIFFLIFMCDNSNEV